VGRADGVDVGLLVAVGVRVEGGVVCVGRGLGVGTPCVGVGAAGMA
jgi:hypothetical protein